VPRAGGEYVYLREAYGPLAAFLTGWTSFVAGFGNVDHDDSRELATRCRGFRGHAKIIIILFTVGVSCRTLDAQAGASLDPQAGAPLDPRAGCAGPKGLLYLSADLRTWR
jgi:APA family basic amino acid/polyamine antiporter